MQRLIWNPYLPEGTFIPDGEPHVFGNRLYVYGSHDKGRGMRYCPGDYQVWSAPVDDLTNWTCEKTAYHRRGKGNRLGIRCMWAPDCTQGADGRYYLYFCFDFQNKVNVLVSNTPDGPFRYYGEVRHPNGTLYGQGKDDIMCFDPAIFRDDDGSVYLYSGYSTNESLRKMLNQRGIRNVDGTGGQVVRLQADMRTVAEKPRMLIPGYKNSAGTGFEGHEMYEASSMRKINGRYYFIYSSRLSHELAYAVSDYPDRDFRYGGAIISNGDIGYQGRKTEDALNYWGNIHGSIVQAAGQWYVFYHRQTNRTEQSRQGCAEPIRIDENGRIAQVEMTSQGLYGKPLPGAGTYPAYIACNLYSEQGAIKCTYGPFCRHQFRMHPCFRMGRDGHQFIQDMRDGATAGFKYFDMQNPKRISVTVRGDSGTVLVRTSPEKQPIAVIQIDKTSAWRTFLANLPPLAGKTELYFTFTGEGKMDFLSFALHETMI